MGPAEQALAIFDALMERRVADFVDETLLGEAVDAMAAPGRSAELWTRFIAPLRTSVLERLAAEPSAKLADAVPAGVLELVIALLPSLPPPPRDMVDKIIGSAEVRAEVRRLLEDTMSELFHKVSGAAPKGTGAALGVFTRAASAAGRGLVGALGGDLDARIRDAVELGVGMAQRRIVDLMTSPENAKRVGKELARLAPKLLELREGELVRYAARVPFPLLDGLAASLFSHNAGRQRVRALVVTEGVALVTRLSDTTIGELLDRFGLRVPLRAATERHGATVVSAVAERLRAGAP